MSDRIEGIPEGYQLGEVLHIDRHSSTPLRVTFELLPIEPEQPKQLEAVVAIPVRELGYESPGGRVVFVAKGGR